MPERDLAARAAELREGFDRSFAEPVEYAAPRTVDFLGIRLGESRAMLDLSELSGLFSERKIAKLPSAHAELLGVAGFRGRLLPVYDLGALLGYAPARAPRWLVVSARVPLAFAFDELDGHVRVPEAAVTGAAGDRHVALGVGVDARESRPVIALGSLLTRIQAAAQGAGT